VLEGEAVRALPCDDFGFNRPSEGGAEESERGHGAREGDYPAALRSSGVNRRDPHSRPGLGGYKVGNAAGALVSLEGLLDSRHEVAELRVVFLNSKAVFRAGLKDGRSVYGLVAGLRGRNDPPCLGTLDLSRRGCGEVELRHDGDLSYAGGG